jgi:pimeloyl-ACP methyl ester carboxylesterase
VTTTRMARIHGHSIRIRISIRTRQRVVGSELPLLLINGLTKSLDAWGPLVDAVPGRTIISFDAPGVGESMTPLWPLSMATLADFAVGVLDELGYEKADVLGYSHGGAVAQQMAFSHPERVDRLILVSTLCGIGAKPGHPRALLQLLPEDVTVGTWWRLLAMAAWTSIPYLGRIKAPTLVVCGTEDRVAPPANSRFLAARIPRAELVMLDGVGHYLHPPKESRLLADVVEEFLARENVAVA